MKEAFNKIREDYESNKDFDLALKKIENLVNGTNDQHRYTLFNIFRNLEEFHKPITWIFWKDQLEEQAKIIKKYKQHIAIFVCLYQQKIKTSIYQKKEANLFVELVKETFGDELFEHLEKEFYEQEKDDIKGLLNYQLIGNTDRKEWIDIHSEKLREDWQGHYYEKQINQIIDDIIKEVS